jgi:hypothetical protein
MPRRPERQPTTILLAVPALKSPDGSHPHLESPFGSPSGASRGTELADCGQHGKKRAETRILSTVHNSVQGVRLSKTLVDPRRKFVR